MGLIKVEQKRDIIYWGNSDYHKVNKEETKYKCIGIVLFTRKRDFHSEQSKDLFVNNSGNKPGFNK